MSEGQIVYQETTESVEPHVHKPFYKKTWFWILIVVIVILLAGLLLVVIYVATRPDTSGPTVNKTIITFNSEDTFPIDAFQTLNVANGSILPFSPPVTSTPPALSFTSTPPSNFIIFNKGGIKGVGVSGVASGPIPQLFINVSPTETIGSIAFRIYELSNLTSATITIGVTAEDNTVANATVQIPQFGVSYIGVTTNLPNIKQIALVRNNALPFGVSLIQFGNVF